MNDLFRLIEEKNIVTVEFQNRNIVLSEDRSLFDDVFFKTIEGKDVVLKGKGDAELYTYASYWCVRNGCRSLSVFEYNMQKKLEIYIQERTLKDKVPEWIEENESRNEKVVGIIPNRNVLDGKWNRQTVEDSCSAFRIDGREKMLVITGRGMMLFYSVIGASAAASGFDAVVVEKPQENMLLRISGDSFFKDSHREKHGIMIGVLGDPNSGKSVLSHVLGCLLEQKSGDKSVWVYDCDAAAPTSDWYIYGLQMASNTDDASRISEDRKVIKQKWTIELENKVINLMDNVKHNLDFIVADLPGGRHDDEKNIHERIPDDGRADMFRRCDYFVLIGRKDRQGAFSEWRKALASYGLEDRIICEVVSSEPKSVPEVINSAENCNQTFSFEVKGLDRCNPRNEIVSKYITGFTSFTEFVTRISGE